jgi:hypothetical protein
MIVMDPTGMDTHTGYAHYNDRVYKVVLKDGVRHMIHLTDEELEIYNYLEIYNGVATY